MNLRAFFNHVTFSDLRALFSLGASKSLEPSDLPPLQADQSSASLCRIAFPHWDAQVATTTTRKLSLFSTLYQVARDLLVISAPLALLEVFLSLALPLVLRELLVWLNNSSSSSIFIGASYVLLLFLLRFLSTVIVGPQAMVYCVRAGIRVETTAMLLISRKMLRLRTGARGTGELVSALALDASRIGPELLTYAHFIWSGPLQIILSTALLFKFIGMAALGALACMVLATFAMYGVVLRERRLYQQIYKLSDSRMRALSGVMDVLRQAKMGAWEDVLSRDVRMHRDAQIKILREACIIEAISYSLWDIAPAVTGVAAFCLAGVIPGSPALTSDIIFPCLAVIEVMKTPLGLMPIITAFAMQAAVSMRRLRKFLDEDEWPGRVVNKALLQEGTAGKIDGGTIGWLSSAGVAIDDEEIEKNEDSSLLNGNRMPTYETMSGNASSETGQGRRVRDGFSPILKKVRFGLPKGSLIIVRGPVGCGKSSLLSAFLGEMTYIPDEQSHSRPPCLSASIVAYTTQIPWIQNASIRDNILFRFGSNSDLYTPIDEEHYHRTLSACGLLPDIEAMPAGDATEIGERGTTLSGGQRARVALARAVYASAECYFLDDPLSALDVHVGEHVFSSVLARGGILDGKTRLLVTHREDLCTRADWVVRMEKGKIVDVSAVSSTALSHDTGKEFVNHNPQQATAGNRNMLSEGALVEEEHRETGSIGLQLYRWYLSLAGLAYPVLSLVGMVGMHIVFLSADACLGVFASVTEEYVASHGAGSSLPRESALWYIGIYLVICCIASGIQLITEIIISNGFSSCSSVVHDLLLDSILTAPVSWLDETPVGRILSRFSGDMMTLDGGLREQIAAFSDIAIRVMETYIVMSVVTPSILLTAPVLFTIYIRVLRHYGKTKRNIERINSTRRSILFSNFSEYCSGLPILRAFGKQGEAFEKISKSVDEATQATLSNELAMHMLNAQVSMVSSIVLCTAASAAFGARNVISPAMAGLCLTWSLRLANPLPYLSIMWAQADSDMIVVERIHEYIYSIPSEKEKLHGEMDAYLRGKGWPQLGNIEFTDVEMRYRPYTPTVLHKLSLKIPAGKRIGVIGRTGAGKSSILNVLLRMTEIYAGQITIDGVDISHVGISLLRSSVATVPQDPGLFRGTMESNLDPRGIYSKAALFKALRMVGMNHSHSLDFEVSHGGSNLSAGERQLVCVARALLEKSKIVVLDEASSYVDYERDRCLQSALRDGLHGSTLIIIAHRIRTVVECDLVVVMDNGKAVEGPKPPIEMLRDSSSKLYGLAMEMGDSALQELQIVAEGLKL